MRHHFCEGKSLAAKDDSIRGTDDATNFLKWSYLSEIEAWIS
jgi:hypothetical protein